VISLLTGQFANKPTNGQSSYRLVNSQTGQFAERSDLKFRVNNRSKCDFGLITLIENCQYSGDELNGPNRAVTRLL